MGRQIQLYMLPQDQQCLLDFLKQHRPTAIVLQDSDSAEVQDLADPTSELRTLTIWNKALLSSLERKLVSHSGRTYYRVDYSLPTLELSPSGLTTWQGTPALTRGRIYGFQIERGGEYERWFKAISYWIKKHFKKSPVNALPGHIGPSALSWFEAGGILLPAFEPPATAAWIELVDSQHPNVIPKSPEKPEKPGQSPQ
jgi:hypothetical protein